MIALIGWTAHSRTATPSAHPGRSTFSRRLRPFPALKRLSQKTFYSTVSASEVKDIRSKTWIYRGRFFQIGAMH